MSAPSFYQVPFSAQTNPTFACPNCSRPFDTNDAVIQHLSGSGPCERWLAETLPNVESADVRPEDEYIDDPEAAQDGMFQILV